MTSSRRFLALIVFTCLQFVSTLPALAARDVTVQLDEVTNLAATVSPDGGELVVDAQGILWRLPIEGGNATPISDPALGAARPDWSPVSDTLVFQAYQEGTFDIWTMQADGSQREQLTTGPWDEREPAWSPDGSRIAFATDRDGSYDIWVQDTASGELSQWTDADTEEAYPAWSPDGSEIAYVVDNTVLATDADGATRSLVDAGIDGIRSPAWTPDGENVVYIRTSPGKAELALGDDVIGQSTDVFPFRPRYLDAGTLLYTADGHIQMQDLATDAVSEVPFAATLNLSRPEYTTKDFRLGKARSGPVRGIVTPALSPDGEQIAFVALNELWLMRVGDLPRQITDDDYYESDPAWSLDGSRIAFVSDRAGEPDIWIHDLASGDAETLGAISGAELYPAWSPDGSQIAYQDQDFVTHVADVTTGTTREVADASFQPGRVSWSADGQRLAYAAVVPYTTRFREGTSQIRIVELQGGDTRYVAPAPNKSITSRGDNGPVWSPDGTAMAFIMDGRLQVAPVDDTGEITSAPVAITEELAESPTWSGDSSTLLYLANGTLKLVPREGGEARTVPLDLTWQTQQSEDIHLVHAGQLWNGVSADIQHDRDILVVDDRIRWIGRHEDELHAVANHFDRLIDASAYTVLPGLFEMHTHQSWGNHTYGYAGRQGHLLLSFGITSTHSVGDLAYRAIADRESIESGARIGPRFFATGEPLDGDRIYYNAMRPMGSDAQFEQELDRAVALDYDSLKTYVRLRPERMGQAARFAHERGLAVWSHFLSPGIQVGQDGTTHLGATERLDYSRIGSLAGRTYDDVISLFADGGMAVMSTFFTAEPSLFLPGTDILDDPRLKHLVPYWEAEKLAADEGIFDEPPTSTFVATLKDKPAIFKKILDRGGRVLAGTDSPLDLVGIGLHSNLRWLTNNGLTPFDALRTATSLPAEQLGVLDDLGTIEYGKLADLVFVDGNPQEQIADLSRVRMVMKAGVLHTVDELIEPYPESMPPGDTSERQSTGGTDEASKQKHAH